jgi:hypothetical protein
VSAILGLPLRFDSGTFTGSIVTADNVTLAHNVHANVGPAIVRACNSHEKLVAERADLFAALEVLRPNIKQSLSSSRNYHAEERFEAAIKIIDAFLAHIKEQP